MLPLYLPRERREGCVFNRLWLPNEVNFQIRPQE